MFSYRGEFRVVRREGQTLNSDIKGHGQVRKREDKVEVDFNRFVNDVVTISRITDLNIVIQYVLQVNNIHIRNTCPQLYSQTY